MSGGALRVAPTARSTTRWPSSPRSFRFLLDITPVDADDVQGRLPRGRGPRARRSPTASSRPSRRSSGRCSTTSTSPSVEDPTLGHLLRAKHREMGLQLEMLRARDSDDFLPLSIELYGAVSPALRRQAEDILGPGPPRPSRAGDAWTPTSSWRSPRREIDHYREVDPDIGIHAEIRARRQRRDGVRRHAAHRARARGAATPARTPCCSTRSAPTSSPRSTAPTSRSGCWAPGSPATTRPRKGWPCSPRSRAAGSPPSGCASSPAAW